MISVAWAQDAVAAPAADLNAMLMSALPFLLVLGVFYFILLRPQMAQAKKHSAMLAELKKGDVIVTDGGLIGEISHVQANTVHLRVNDSLTVTVAREAVRSTLQGDAAKGWEAKGKVADAIVKKR